MPELKEPAFFASDMRARFQRPSSGALPQTLAEYLSLFAAARPEQLVGEASSSYIVSRAAARNIAEVQPGRARSRSCASPRASCARSICSCCRTTSRHEKDLRKAIALESERRQGRHIPRRSPRPQALLYSERVRYVEQLRRYHERFSPERVLVLIYDDFRRENEATVRRVLRFLGVDDTMPIASIEANPTVRVRSQQLDDLVHKISVGRGPVSRAVKASVKARHLQRVAPRRAAGGAPSCGGRRAAAGG